MFIVSLCLICPFLLLRASPPCPRGGVYNDEATLCILPLFWGTFSEGQSACAARGATLPYVLDREINKGLARLYFESAYHGRNFWLGKDPNAEKWLNGDPMTYKNWGEGIGTNDSWITCAALDRQYKSDDMYWIPQNCSASLLIVCTYVAPSRFCDVGWDYLSSGSSSACYMQILWPIEEAAKACFSEMGMSGNVTSIHSAAENELILQWLFLKEQNTKGGGEVHYWLGQKTNENGTAIWFDGTPTDYTNYAPTVRLGEKDVCTTISLNTGGGFIRGMWYTFDCEDNPIVLGSVCKANTYENEENN